MSSTAESPLWTRWSREPKLIVARGVVAAVGDSFEQKLKRTDWYGKHAHSVLDFLPFHYRPPSYMR